jgi:hypothetical protein
VSVGVYTHESIHRQLADAAEDKGKEPITLTPPGRTNRNVLQRAVDLLYEETDGRSKKVKSNYFKVDPTMKLEKRETVGKRGYVFNCSSHMWQADDHYRCTAERARLFLRSKLLGLIKADSTWAQAKDICLLMHFVWLRDDGTYECDCAAYWKVVECSHVAASQHLDKVIDLEAELQLIQRAKRPGRPRNYMPVDYSAHAQVMPASVTSEVPAANHIGLLIARRIRTNSDKIYIGRVSGTFCVYRYCTAISCHF